MRRASVGHLVVAVAVLLAVLLGAPLLDTHGARAVEMQAGETGTTEHGPGHQEPDADDAVGERRAGPRANAGVRAAPPATPATGTVVPFAGAAAFDHGRDTYRSALRYGITVPPDDTSPESLQVARC